MAIDPLYHIPIILQEYEFKSMVVYTHILQDGAPKMAPVAWNKWPNSMVDGIMTN